MPLLPEADGAEPFTVAFRRGLLDPMEPTPEGLCASSGRRPDRRYNVYRNNVTVSLIEALAAVFPGVRTALGEAPFRDIARDYVRIHPPCSPLLFLYGEHFPVFLEESGATAHMAFLPDLARLERLWLDAYHAADHVPMAPAALAALAPEALAAVRLRPHPATRLLFSGHPVADLFRRYRETAAAGPATDGQAQTVLVTRPYLKVTLEVIDSGSTEFLTTLLAGHQL
jgi:hypothetical protein